MGGGGRGPGGWCLTVSCRASERPRYQKFLCQVPTWEAVGQDGGALTDGISVLTKEAPGRWGPGDGGEVTTCDLRNREVHETPDPLAPRLWASQPPDCEKSISVFLSHPVFLLQSPK